MDTALVSYTFGSTLEIPLQDRYRTVAEELTPA
jgi:hypothetical protein